MSRAQRLWMGHYKHLLRGLGDFPSCVVSYEYWLDIHLANKLKSLAKFLGIVCTDDQYQKALAGIRPDLTMVVDQLPQNVIAKSPCKFSRQVRIWFGSSHVTQQL